MASKFLEFLKQKDKVKTSLVPDYDGPQPNTPPDGGAPYKATTGGKSGGKDKGFADLGDQPEYKPGQAKAAKKAEQVKESNFVDKTKNMDREKFLNYMRKNSKNSFEVYETAARVASTIRQNPNAAEAIIREAKRNGTLPRLVKEMAKHKEFFEAFAYVMGSKQMGDQVCRRLARAMNEVVGPPAPPMGHDKPSAFGGLKKPSAPPLSDDEDDMSDDDEDSDMGMGDDSDMGDDMGDDDALGGGADDLDLDLDFGDDSDGGLGDSPNSGMDDMGLNDEPAVGDDEEDDDDMSDDDDEGDMSSDDSNPFGKKPGLPAPRPSMMARMMRKEAYTPAQRKFYREMRNW